MDSVIIAWPVYLKGQGHEIVFASWFFIKQIQPLPWKELMDIIEGSMFA